jgi:hypothetical protein
VDTLTGAEAAWAAAAPVTEAEVEATAAALRSRNITVRRVATGAEAVGIVLDTIRPPARVLSGGSRTVSQLRLPEALRSTPGIEYLNDTIRGIPDAAHRYAYRRTATACDYVIGSANAIVTDGRIVNVDGGGSRISSYAYAADRVILIVGTHKICRNLDAAVDRVRRVAVRRVHERGPSETAGPPCAPDGVCREAVCRPPERECGKMLIIEKETIPDRILMVLVDQPVGY